MNKLEYIPGDLVMVKESALQFAKDKIFKVISSLSGGFLKVVMLNDSSTTYSISNNAIRPIPLTPEILKKNGWEKLYETFFEKNVNNIRLTIELSENIYVAINRIFIMEIHYIHELQHLLFGLGINHEMEVQVMLYALRFFDTERSLWYLDCVHRSKSFLKRREKKFLKQGIKTMISKWYGFQ